MDRRGESGKTRERGHPGTNREPASAAVTAVKQALVVLEAIQIQGVTDLLEGYRSG